MSSIFRRSNGVYYLVTSLNGRRIWTSTGCRRKDEAIRFALSQKRKPKEPSPVASSPVRLSQFTTQLLSSLKVNLAPGTLQLYRSSLSLFKKIAGDRPLPDYTPQMMEEFKSVRLSQVSPVKVNIDFRTLRAAFNIAVSWGIIEENPFKRVKQVRVPQVRPAYLTQEEFARVIAAIPTDWFREIVRFAVATMMRLGEIVNLRWESVDLARRIILVENTSEFRTKTRKSRAIPMDELVFHTLRTREHLSDRVFTFPSARPLSVGYVSRTFKKYALKAGVSDEIHFHSLRHTGATWLVQKDVPIYSVQQILGHSRVDMTQIYSHLDVEHLRKPLAKMAEMLGSS